MLSSLSELWRAGEGLYSEENTENETIDLRKKKEKKPSKYFKTLLNKAKKPFSFQNDFSEEC